MAANYSPPTASEILRRQDEDDALRPLIAQRRMYTRTKRWQTVRLIGIVVIGLGAPVVTVASPGLAVLVGAAAGVWLFLGRTLFKYLEKKGMARAAATQQLFDQYVFGMPALSPLAECPSFEDIAAVAGPDEDLAKVARKEKLLAWYPVDPEIQGVNAVAIAQRANAEYSNRLLKQVFMTLLIFTLAWAVVLIAFSVFALRLPSETLLLGVILPVLPATLDVYEQLAGIRNGAKERSLLVERIELRLSQSEQIKPEELLVWQDATLELRRSTPQIPDWLYKLMRRRNERAMHTAARQLAKRKK